MEVKDGRITTPGGMSYRVLVLPPEDRMTLPVQPIHAAGDAALENGFPEVQKVSELQAS